MEPVDRVVHEPALDFATHSWDLATGGLKTLTAKRELPTLSERRMEEAIQIVPAAPRSSMAALLIVASLVLLLIGVGVILCVMLQLY